MINILYIKSPTTKYAYLQLWTMNRTNHGILFVQNIKEEQNNFNKIKIANIYIIMIDRKSFWQKENKLN